MEIGLVLSPESGRKMEQITGSMKGSVGIYHWSVLKGTGAGRTVIPAEYFNT